MSLPSLLRFLLSNLQFCIVEVGGGAAVVDEAKEGAAADESGATGEGQDGDDAAEEDEAEEGAAEDAAGTGEDAGAEGELVVSIGDEPAAEEDDPARAPEWIRELRKSNREKERRIRELEAKVAAATPAQQAIVVGPEPELEEFADAAAIAKYKADLAAWHDRKRQADEQQRSLEAADRAARTQWERTLADYGKAKGALKVRDFDEAEATAQDLFSVMQQGLLLKAKRPAELIYALGKNPKVAKQLAAVSDPVDFVYAVGEIVSKLKVTPRKTAPPPDTVVRSAVPGSASGDGTLKRLQAEADKTGDRTKVAAYMRQQKLKQAA